MVHLDKEYPFIAAFLRNDIPWKIFVEDLEIFLNSDAEFRKAWESAGFEVKKYSLGDGWYIRNRFKTLREDGTLSEKPVGIDSLSTPILEKIWRKAKDINLEWTAFSAVKPSLLKNILTDGLLGRGPETTGEGDFEKDVNKEQWVKNARQHGESIVWFNIIGRNVHDARDHVSVRVNEYTWMVHDARDSVAIMFRLDKFKEVPYKRGDKWQPILQPNTYAAYQGDYSTGVARAYYEYGWVLHARVAPRFFRGVIFRSVRKLSESELDSRVKLVLKKNLADKYSSDCDRDEHDLREQDKYKYCEETDKTKLMKKANKIASLMLETYKGKEEFLLPIYNANGDLYWPEYRPYSKLEGKGYLRYGTD